MHFEERARIDTPEGVTLDLRLAGIGSRMLAWMLDGLIKLAGFIALMVLAAVTDLDGAVVLGLIAVYALAAFFFYDVAFEVLWGGRTPGKRAMGLRVTMSSGTSIGFTASAVRNMLRLVDFLPGLYAVGIVSIGVTKWNQRIGDLAASTLVVREGTSVEIGTTPLPEVSVPVGLDVTAVTGEQLVLARKFLDRRQSMSGGSRIKLAATVAAKLRPTLGGPISHLDDEELIEVVVVAKARSG
ncbi:MAG: RDD family protein [Acidimicrobiia bacterium]|nr:MAG: RDD family protein [Acidimicrobiia bacterium]